VNDDGKAIMNKGTSEKGDYELEDCSSETLYNKLRNTPDMPISCGENNKCRLTPTLSSKKGEIF
jgi:hypothetical protein